MSAPELLGQLHRCLRYQQARPWQKPWINPRRFLRNQLDKFGFLSGAPASIRAVNAFHLADFAVVNGEGVSQEIASYGFFEPALTEAFLRLIRPGQIVLDIGMHVGYYTTLFALLVGEQGQVHGFEPTPSTREIALRNTSRFSQIQVHPFAVWSSPQTLRFRDFGPQWMAFNSSGRSKLESDPVPPKLIDVQTTTLDQFRQSLERPVSLVKIDAESAEREIIAGGKSLIETDHPIITVEVGDQKNSTESRRLVDDLIALGYVAWEFQSRSFQRHRLREVYGYDNLIFAPADQDISSA